jgi:hypothetical protein
MASKTARILFYTTTSIMAYFITYIFLIQVFFTGVHNPDLQLVKTLSGFSGLAFSLILYGFNKWSQRKIKKGKEWAKDMGDKGREKLDSLRS